MARPKLKIKRFWGEPYIRPVCERAEAGKMELARRGWATN